MQTCAGRLAAHTIASATSPALRGVDPLVNCVGLCPVALQAHNGKLGLGHAGVDGADAQAGAVQLQPQRLGDAQLRRLAGAVGRTALVRHTASDRADVQNNAAGVRLHQRQHGAGHAQDAQRVGLEHRLPIVVPAVLDSLHPVRAAGIVDEHVHPAGGCLGPVRERINACRIGDVQLVNVRRGRTALEALGGDLLEAILPARAQQQVHAHVGELPGRLCAEPARGAGHESPFALESIAHGQRLNRSRPGWPSANKSCRRGGSCPTLAAHVGGSTKSQ